MSGMVAGPQGGQAQRAPRGQAQAPQPGGRACIKVAGAPGPGRKQRPWTPAEPEATRADGRAPGLLDEEIPVLAQLLQAAQLLAQVGSLDPVLRGCIGLLLFLWTERRKGAGCHRAARTPCMAPPVPPRGARRPVSYLWPPEAAQLSASGGDSKLSPGSSSSSCSGNGGASSDNRKADLGIQG